MITPKPRPIDLYKVFMEKINVGFFCETPDRVIMEANDGGILLSRPFCSKAEGRLIILIFGSRDTSPRGRSQSFKNVTEIIFDYSLRK